jgi:outer membrane protein OmpA-like peptidoglycan-associated protein
MKMNKIVFTGLFLVGSLLSLAQSGNRFEIKNLELNDKHSDIGAAYLQHGRVVFASTRPAARPVYREWKKSKLPMYDMYIANIVDQIELDEPKLLDWELNQHFNEGPATFSADGEFAVFTMNMYDTDGVKRLKLVSSVVNSRGWGAPVELPFNNVSYSVGHPTLSYDGRTLYFASDMPGGQGGVDLYKVSRTLEGVWGYPENLGASINTKGDDMFPFIHNSGLLFFSSNGRGGMGGLDIFVANLAAGSATVEALEAPINSSADDFSFLLAEDQKTGFFSSNREEGKGNDDLYSFRNNKDFKTAIALKGIATDMNGQPLQGTLIELQDESGNVLASTTCDANCEFNFQLDPGKKYFVVAKKDGYYETKEEVSTTSDDKEIIKNIKLAKVVKMALVGRVTDAETGNPIANAQVVVFDNKTKKKESYTTDANGSFRHLMNDKKLNESGVFDIQLEAEGYLSVTKTYKRTLDKEGDYNVSAETSYLKMSKVKTGVTRLEDLIDINPIYYDLGSAEIRPDAAIELDKIVAVMNINPTLEIELGSHTDSRGSDADNQRLSQLRAEVAAAYIKQRITNPERIYGKGYGESKILNKCKNNVQCTEQEHQVNRRTEFKIIKM